MDYKKYKTVGEWSDDARKQDYSIPLQAKWALSLEMEIFQESFPEACEKFIKEGKLLLVNKTYIFNISYLTKLLEIKN